MTTAPAERQVLDAGRVKRIKTLQSKLRMPDEEYRRLLLVECFASSCTELTPPEADLLIEVLTERAVAAGVWDDRRHASRITDHGLRSRYDDLGVRPGMASPKQLRMIEAMWAEVSFHKDRAKREAALGWFVWRLTKKQKMEWLTSGDVRKVVRAIEEMKKKKEVL